MEDFITTLKIKERSIVPKYHQVANGLLKLIKSGRVKEDEILPSLHELSTKLEISRKSVEKAYKLLKDQGIVISVQGIGFFATGQTVNRLLPERQDSTEINKLILANGEVLYLPELDPDIVRKLRGLCS